VRKAQESSVDTDAFLVHTQINVSTQKEVFFPIKRFFFQPQRNNSRRQPFLVHTQINVSTPEEVLFLVQQQQPKSGKNARS
jgi:hypothetical protein